MLCLTLFRQLISPAPFGLQFLLLVPTNQGGTGVQLTFNANAAASAGIPGVGLGSGGSNISVGSGWNTTADSVLGSRNSSELGGVTGKHPLPSPYDTKSAMVSAPYTAESAASFAFIYICYSTAPRIVCSVSSTFLIIILCLISHSNSFFPHI